MDFEKDKVALMRKFDRELKRLCEKHLVELSSARDDVYSNIAVDLNHRDRKRESSAKRKQSLAIHESDSTKKMKNEECDLNISRESALENNPFKLLSDNEDIEEINMAETEDHVKGFLTVTNKKFQRRKRIAVNVNANVHPEKKQKNNGETKDKTTKIENTKAGKSPPIICYDLHVQHLSKALAALEEPPKFTIKNLNKSKTVIKPATITDQKKIFQVLKKHEVKAHTFTPKEERDQVLLLRGPHYTYDPEEIFQELKEAAPEVNILKVENFKTRMSIKMGINYNLFLIKFDADSNPKDLTTLKVVAGQLVTWERKKIQNEVQCHNCQVYGHVAVNCSASYRCMKCRGGHTPGNCPQNKTEEEGDTLPPFCVLCNTEGHVTSYKGCQAYQKIKKERKRKLAEATEKRQLAQAAVANTIKPGKTFADLFTNSKPKVLNNNVNDKTNITTNGEVNNFITGECQDLFGMNLFTLVGKIKDFMPAYKAAKTRQERLLAYMDFACQLCK